MSDNEFKKHMIAILAAIMFGTFGFFHPDKRISFLFIGMGAGILFDTLFRFMATIGETTEKGDTKESKDPEKK